MVGTAEIVGPATETADFVILPAITSTLFFCKNELVRSFFNLSRTKPSSAYHAFFHVNATLGIGIGSAPSQHNPRAIEGRPFVPFFQSLTLTLAPLPYFLMCCCYCLYSCMHPSVEIVC